MTEQQFNEQYGPDALNMAIELGFDRDELLTHVHTYLFRKGMFFWLQR